MNEPQDQSQPLIAIANRFYVDKAENVPANLEKLDAYLSVATAYARDVYVAVNTALDKSNAIAYIAEHFPTVKAIGMSWRPKQFALPMNVLVDAAAFDGNDVFVAVSTEMLPKKGYVDALIEHLDDDTLVAGARCEGHVFGKGTEQATGSSIPWNTFAAWNLKRLANIGFPMIGDAPTNDKIAGVEELSAVSIQQWLWHRTGFPAMAKLVTMKDFPGEWDMSAWDDARHAKHAAKMESRVARPAWQLEQIRMPPPVVSFIR